MQMNNSSDKHTERLLERVSGLSVPANRSHDDVWNSIEQRITDDTPIIYMWDAKRLVLRGIAASFLLAICFSLTIFLSQNSISVGNGEKQIVFLPDNSKVELNSATTISYNSVLWYLRRTVELDGEAFFEVEKGSNFDVISGSKMVSVLGTSFNVYARGNQFNIACFTGKVRVKDQKSGNKVVLTPGFRTAKNMEARNFEVQKTASWKHNEFYFNASPLSEVIAELERQFDIIINAENFSERLYTGGFKSTNINNALDLVFIPMGLEYQIDNNTITIKSSNTFN